MRRALWLETAGASAIEYTVVACGVACVCIAGGELLGGELAESARMAACRVASLPDGVSRCGETPRAATDGLPLDADTASAAAARAAHAASAEANGASMAEKLLAAYEKTLAETTAGGVSSSFASRAEERQLASVDEDTLPFVPDPSVEVAASAGVGHGPAPPPRHLIKRQLGGRGLPLRILLQTITTWVVGDTFLNNGAKDFADGALPGNTQDNRWGKTSKTIPPEDPTNAQETFGATDERHTRFHDRGVEVTQVPDVIPEQPDLSEVDTWILDNVATSAGEEEGHEAGVDRDGESTSRLATTAAQVEAEAAATAAGNRSNPSPSWGSVLTAIVLRAMGLGSLVHGPFGVSHSTEKDAQDRTTAMGDTVDGAADLTELATILEERARQADDFVTEVGSTDFDSWDEETQAQWNAKFDELVRVLWRYRIGSSLELGSDGPVIAVGNILVAPLSEGPYQLHENLSDPTANFVVVDLTTFQKMIAAVSNADILHGIDDTLAVLEAEAERLVKTANDLRDRGTEADEAKRVAFTEGRVQLASQTVAALGRHGFLASNDGPDIRLGELRIDPLQEEERRSTSDGLNPVVNMKGLRRALSPIRPRTFLFQGGPVIGINWAAQLGLIVGYRITQREADSSHGSRRGSSILCCRARSYRGLTRRCC